MADNTIFIRNFSIAPDGLTLDVTVETTAGYIIDEADLWTDSTFQDENQLIDISSLLTGTSNQEVFTIPAATAGVSNFYDGIFFVRFGSTAPDVTDCDTCNNKLGVAAKLISAKLCLMEKVLALDVCSDCNHSCSCIDKCDVIVLDKYIKAMTIAIEFGVYDEAIDLLNGIRKLCTTCSECLNLDNYNSNSGLGFYTLNNTTILQ
tara:strand:+ start:18284 stop:18898 length:615 start_codon:yes stop_codon:yes gene_type:complete